MVAEAAAQFALLFHERHKGCVALCRYFQKSILYAYGWPPLPSRHVIPKSLIIIFPRKRRIVIYYAIRK